MAATLTASRKALLAAIAEGGSWYTLGWRSAPGRPALSRGAYTADGVKISPARYNALRAAGLVKHDLDRDVAAGWEIVVTDAGRAQLAA